MDNQYSLFEFEDMIFPYYPKGIAYSWNYDDELGEKLMEILDVYNKLKC